METNGFAQRPSRQEAEAALRSVEEARAAADAVEAPLWYFAALGAWVAPTGLIASVPSTAGGVVLTLGALVLWMGLFGVILGVGLRQMGVVRALTRQALVHMCVILLLVGVAAGLIGLALGTSWSWGIFSGAEGAGIALYGLWLRLQGHRSA